MPLKLTKNLFCYTWSNVSINNCNAYLIGEAPFILIDPGLDVCLPQLMAAMKRDGIDPEMIKLIITTHSHPDHFDGVRSFAAKNTTIALHKDEETFLRQHGDQFYSMFGLKLPPYNTPSYLEEGECELLNTVMGIYHTPGHSPGSLSIYLPDSKSLIVGDVIFQAGVGRTDFPGGDGKLLKKSIDRLSRLNAEFLLPGHGDLLQGSNRVKRNFDYVADVYYSMI